MRFLFFLTDGYGGIGGIAKFNRDFIEALCAFPSCENVIALPRLMPNPSEKHPAKLDYILEGLSGKAGYFVTALKTIFQKKIDFIICGHIHLLPLAYLAKIVTGKPLLLITHGIEIWQPAKNSLTNYLVGKIDGYISVSQFTKSKFSEWAPVSGIRAYILANCVDLSKFSPGEKNPLLLQKYQLNGKRILMTVGRLAGFDRYKGFDEMLEILPSLAEQIPNICYLIVGDGPDKARLQQKAKTLGIADRVIFTGYIAEEEKCSYYRLADLYVMPGRKEGFGIVYLEAIASGVPVIGSSLDGSRDALASGKFGVLVNPNDKTEIRNAVLKCLQDKKTPPDIKNVYGYENFKSRVWEILENLISAKSGCR